LAINFNLIFRIDLKCQGFIRTSINTFAASNAKTFIIPDCNVLADSFRAVTPDTIERASFQKN